MSKYLDLIRGIEDDPPRNESLPSYDINDQNDKRVTARSLLASSRYGSLSYGALRDHLIIHTGYTTREAEALIEIEESLGYIHCGPDGLYRVVA